VIQNLYGMVMGILAELWGGQHQAYSEFIGIRLDTLDHDEDTILEPFRINHVWTVFTVPANGSRIGL
jgi:hypothetical protein